MELTEDWADRGVPPSSPGENRQNWMSKLGWLSATTVHDLRSPLGTVVAAAEILRESDLPPTQVKRLAENIYKAASRMRELLADLADASFGNRSAIDLCDIREVISAASEAVLPTSERHAVQILNGIPSGIEIPLQRSRMEAVFFNLIINALEAMPHGGEIRLAARNADHSVLIEVEDTGPGVAAAIQERLFEPFVTSGKDHGLGLGLAISRETVLDHGGDIWMEPADGARFVVRLPLKRSEMKRLGSPLQSTTLLNSSQSLQLFPTKSRQA